MSDKEMWKKKMLKPEQGLELMLINNGAKPDGSDLI